MDKPEGASNDAQLRRKKMEEEFIRRMTRFRSNMNDLKMFLETREVQGGLVSGSTRRTLHRWAISHYMEGNDLYYQWKEKGLKVLCSGEEVFEALRECHSDGSQHFGINVTQELLTRKYFWKGLSIDVRNFISNCPVCRKQAKNLISAATLEQRHRTQPVGLVDINVTELEKRSDVNRETPLHSREADITHFQVDEAAGACSNVPSLNVVADDREKTVELAPVVSSVSDSNEKCVELAPVVSSVSDSNEKCVESAPDMFSVFDGNEKCVESASVITNVTEREAKTSPENSITYIADCESFLQEPRMANVCSKINGNNLGSSNGLTYCLNKKTYYHAGSEVHNNRLKQKHEKTSKNSIPMLNFNDSLKVYRQRALAKLYDPNITLTDNVLIARHQKEPLPKLFKCNICGSGFNDNLSLVSHVSLHNFEQIYLIDIGGVKFVTTPSVLNCGEILLSQNPYYNDVCSAKYIMPSLQTDEQINKPLNHYLCEICGEKCCTLFSLQKHMKLHESYQCDTCGASFKFKSTLRSHKFKHSVKARIKTKVYKCKFCCANFVNAYRRKAHVWKHFGEKPYKCNICGSSFISNFTLKTHKRIHTEEKSIQCEICGATFRQYQNLKRHSLIHSGEKSCLCDVCGAKFYDNSEFRRHKIIHTGQKPYKCDICKCSFTFLGNFKAHKRVHTGDRPYKCDICGARFKQSTYLPIHKRIHTGERPYTCSICNASFARKKILLKHIRVH